MFKDGIKFMKDRIGKKKKKDASQKEALSRITSFYKSKGEKHISFYSFFYLWTGRKWTLYTFMQWIRVGYITVKHFLIIYFVLPIALSVEFIKKGDFSKESSLMHVTRLSPTSNSWKCIQGYQCRTSNLANLNVSVFIWGLLSQICLTCRLKKENKTLFCATERFFTIYKSWDIAIPPSSNWYLCIVSMIDTNLNSSNG